jgi:hypothetical protein
MPKLPTGELVAVAYAKAVLTAAGKATVPVVTTLPAVSDWVTTGALQVGSIVGAGGSFRGGGGRDTNLRDMVVSYEGWAARPNSDKPPWGQANELLEILRADTFDGAEGFYFLTLAPAGVYEDVLCQSSKPLTEPRRIPDPDTSRAHYTMDLRLFWTVR